MVVAVTDGPRRSVAGRVVVALAVALTLLWSGTSAQPEMGGGSPSRPSLQATLKLPHGVLSGHVTLVGTAARPAQHNRRGYALIAVLAAALADIVVAATRDRRVARPRHEGCRLLALGPRAPPFRS